MITGDQAYAAAALLWDCWHRGDCLPSLPSHLRPHSREDGYAIQAVLQARSGAPLFGWKIAATSIAGQQHIAVDGPLAGRLFAERVFHDGGTVPFGHNRMRVAEAEFAFRMGRDLSPRGDEYTIDDVLDAVASLHPAIEFPDSRYVDFTSVGAAQLIADNACAHYFVLGTAANARWRDANLAAHAVTGTIAGRLSRGGRGANVLGDPRIALAWLANELSRLHVTLRVGEIVTTGTCLVPLEIEPGDHVAMDFGSLGHVEARVGD
jgi:2-keto-4-pentenoate hydratase